MITEAGHLSDGQRAALLALAERCEAATGYDPDLDTDIALALSLVPGWAIRGKGVNRNNWGDGRGGYWTCPDYTASVDAALSLVPEGWECIRIERQRAWEGQPDGWLFEAAMLQLRGEGYAAKRAATRALAICAAALRARASAQVPTA